MKINYTLWLKRLGLILLIIFLGTIIDYIVHHMDSRFYVEFAYYPHKLFFGTLWAFLGYLVLKKYLTTPAKAAFVIAAVPAVLLQVMYVIKAHQPLWVIVLFLVLHFFMFLIPGLYICKSHKDIFLPPASAGQ